MTKVLLIRHAQNDWVKTGKLAGRISGVHLNDVGQAQAEALGKRLATAPLKAVYSSPMERTQETAQAIVTHHPYLPIQTLEGVNELEMGAWEGQALKTLQQRKMWRLVQGLPSRAVFPGGETFRHAQARAVDAIEAVVRRHPREMIAVVSHSDIIKLVVAHYLGMHLDIFQRLAISTASITTLQLSAAHTMVVHVNDTSHCPKIDKQTAHGDANETAEENA